MFALARKRSDGAIELCAPTVGFWREAPQAGALLRPGMRVGAIEVLGRLFDVLVPDPVTGLVLSTTTPAGSLPSRQPVAYGDPLVELGLETPAPLGAAESGNVPQHRTSGWIVEAPMSGRFYRRASPEKAAFVEEGDEVGPGQTICLLEVMKTFNRIAYGGGSHPERARVLRVIPADGDDLAAGDPILELQPL